MKQPQYAEYNQLYVWELPTRLFHLINILSISVLGVTGYFIASPIPLLSSGEAYSKYSFGGLRFVHFVVAYIFTVNFLGRLYWGFVGNRFAKWKNMLPLSKSKWQEIGQVFCLDILLICKLPIKSVGINALAGIIYLMIYLAMLFEIFTGFALYSVMSPSPFAGLFHWVIPLFGGIASVRQWHHMFTWIFFGFTILHIYLGLYHDYLEGRGTISSMVGGWKFIEKQPDV